MGSGEPYSWSAEGSNASSSRLRSASSAGRMDSGRLKVRHDTWPGWAEGWLLLRRVAGGVEEHATRGLVGLDDDAHGLWPDDADEDTEAEDGGRYGRPMPPPPPGYPMFPTHRVEESP